MVLLLTTIVTAPAADTRTHLLRLPPGEYVTPAMRKAIEAMLSDVIRDRDSYWQWVVRRAVQERDKFWFDRWPEGRCPGFNVEDLEALPDASSGPAAAT